MNMLIVRAQRGAQGIFGGFFDDLARQVGVTLEHAYLDGDAYVPKIPAGVYTCKRSKHTLEHHPEPFETFQIMNVPGHSNCLFHWGNKESDSDGCVLLGTRKVDALIVESKAAWERFMALQAGVDSFTLRIQ